MDEFDDQYGYDPDRAVQLLAEAGYGPGDISIDMSSTVIPGNPEFPQLIEILSTMWEAVGVDTNIIDVEFGAWVGTLRNHDIHETFVILRNTPIRTTQQGLRVFWVSEPNGFLYGWESDFINEKYDCLERSLDVAEREQCARDAGDGMFDDFLTLPLFQTTFDMTIDPEFIAGWDFPGVGFAHPTHVHNIKACPVGTDRCDTPTSTSPPRVRLNSKYDDDGDRLIEVSDLEQFNAIRYDLNGDGRPDSDSGAEIYAAAFPTSAGEAVCISNCNGYELTRSLDFDDGDSYASGAVNARWTSGIGWLPIGIGENRFNSMVDGNGLTISNLYINRTTALDNPGAVGLFGLTGRASVIQEIGLVSVDVAGVNGVGGLAGGNEGTISASYATGTVSGDGAIGGLAGLNVGTISASYSTGTVSGDGTIGGLAGRNEGTISASYATGNVSGGSEVGGLVGVNQGTINANYATGTVLGDDSVGGLIGSNSGDHLVAASYATGPVSGSSNVGGLIGGNSGTVIGGFWDTLISGLTTGVGTGDSAGVVGKTTAELQSPTGSGYRGIYSAWEIDFDNADQDFDPMTGAEDYWDFGTGSQYPALKADIDGNGTATWQEFGRQRINTPPEFPAAQTERSVPENLAEGENIGGPVVAEDAEDDTLTYALGGVDAASFDIVASSGQLQTKAALDFETKFSYTVTVSVHDGQDADWNADTTSDATVTVTITVTGVTCLSGGAVADPANNPGLAADCEVLLAAKETLVGTATLDWAASVPIDQWEGVTVGGTSRRVIGLTLGWKGLTGLIPAELGSLTNLEILALTGNELTGIIPPGLGQLTNLGVLALGANELTGPIPAALGDLPNLQELSLWGNQLTGPIPSALSTLTSLEVLSLSQNQLTGTIPTEMGSLANLEELFLSGNQLTGCIPAGIAGVANNDLNQLGLPFCAGALGSSIISVITPGVASLTVTWVTPSMGSGATIIAYDLRYIESVASDKSDANWTIMDSAWTTGSGTLSYQISGLTSGTQYDVQVRAVVAAGDGSWSATAAVTPATWGAIRSFSTPSVSPGGQVMVTITANGFGAFGEVVETLPPGFNVVASSLPGGAVQADDQEVSFILVGDTSLTYSVTAPSAAGSYSFSGVLTNSDGEEVPVGGALSMTVGSLPSVSVSRAAGSEDTKVRPGSPISLTATFSRPVSGFTVDDITVGNGTVGNFAGSGAVYTFDVTPDDIGEVTVAIAGGVAEDAAGNSNEAAPRFYLGITYDDDGDGGISKNEAIAAVVDYFAGGITKAQTIAVIVLYFSTPAEPEPSEKCIQAVSTDGTVYGQWASGCDSEARSGSHARYYTFTLDTSSEVTVRLESSAVDNHLYLRSGDATSGTARHENDDHEGSTSVSQIQETLAAGSYTVEATTYSAGATGAFSLTISGLGEGDRANLVALYNATGGPNWERHNNWLSDMPISEWSGVTTGDNGRVTGLYLYENQLSGGIPPELGNLANLTRLRLGGNQLSGEIPPELGNLANLTRLRLGGNQLSGEIPPELYRRSWATSPT